MRNQWLGCGCAKPIDKRCCDCSHWYETGGVIHKASSVRKQLSVLSPPQRMLLLEAWQSHALMRKSSNSQGDPSDPSKTNNHSCPWQTNAQLVLGILDAEDPLTVSDLCIAGGDIVSLLGKSGPVVGIILASLLDYVINDPSRNQRDTLIARAKHLIDVRPVSIHID